MLLGKKEFGTKVGFTLVEIILVVIILGILAVVVVSVIKPYRQIARARNTRRRIDIHMIALGVKSYQAQNGDLPLSITQEPKEICKEHAVDCTGYVDLSVLLKNEQYLTLIPVDPQDKTFNGTGYEISRTQYGKITVHSLLAELGETIEISR
ncbi:prepilin-type N-terminal cleavage/methylation domain-containing protein [Patescibacteria group bacterium]|nr:prepilin-type N-terminal cleavage/methylation domain-containing protein [Patescibacteria group bacterium]